MSDDILTSVEARLIAASVDAVRADVGEMKVAIREMSGALLKLAAIEQQHLETRHAMDRAFQKIEDFEKRLRPIEIAIPGLVETRGWVITMGLAALSMLLLAVVALVLRPPVAVYEAPASPVHKAPTALPVPRY
jgi:hypothetical protein